MSGLSIINPDSFIPTTTDDTSTTTTTGDTSTITITGDTSTITTTGDTSTTTTTNDTSTTTTTGDNSDIKSIIGRILCSNNEVLGTGGTANTLLVNGATTKYAVKKSNLGFNDMVEREYYILRKLDHPNIIGVMGAFSIRHTFYIVMECGEKDLFDCIKNGCYINIISTVRQVLSALKYLHKIDIVHGDIKTENILIFGDGLVKLIDFGSAQKSSERLPIISTPLASSPEEILETRGDGVKTNGKKGDIWAVGVVLYILRFKTLPFCNPNHSNCIYDEWLDFVKKNQGSTSIPKASLFRLNNKRKPDDTTSANDSEDINNYRRPVLHYTLSYPYLELLDQLMTLIEDNRPSADEAVELVDKLFG